MLLRDLREFIRTRAIELEADFCQTTDGITNGAGADNVFSGNTFVGIILHRNHEKPSRVFLAVIVLELVAQQIRARDKIFIGVERLTAAGVFEAEFQLGDFLNGISRTITILFGEAGDLNDDVVVIIIR